LMARVAGSVGADGSDREIPTRPHAAVCGGDW
jgi:hypothetical protein